METFVALPVRERRDYSQYKIKYVLESTVDIEQLKSETTQTCYNALADDPDFVSCMILNSVTGWTK